MPRFVAFLRGVSPLNAKMPELKRCFEEAGWIEDRVSGSHHIFKHPKIAGHLTVPHPKKDLGKGLVSKIRKQAQLK